MQKKLLLTLIICALETGCASYSVSDFKGKAQEVARTHYLATNRPDCFFVSRQLTKHLAGWNAQQVIATSNYIRQESLDLVLDQHAFTIVDIEGTPIIVDGTYQQYLRIPPEGFIPDTIDPNCLFVGTLDELKAEFRAQKSALNYPIRSKFGTQDLLSDAQVDAFVDDLWGNTVRAYKDSKK